MTTQSTHAYEFLAHTGSAAIANTCICVLAGEAGDVQNKECLARLGQPRKHCSASLHHITARFESRVLSVLWWVNYRMKPPQVYHAFGEAAGDNLRCIVKTWDTAPWVATRRQRIATSDQCAMGRTRTDVATRMRRASRLATSRSHFLRCDRPRCTFLLTCHQPINAACRNRLKT